ncbi:MAG: choice-of-anchor Q domain-containing protein [Chthoniobacterales bacterium]
MKRARLISLFFAVTLASAQSATLNVTSTADSGAGSLRDQIGAAVTGDTVAIIVIGSIGLTTGEIAIAGKDLIVAGPGANNLTITTNATTRALRITNASCTISGITFNNCKAIPGDIDTGGAIFVDNFSSGGNAKTTTIRDCAFTNNQSGWGGAVDIFQGGLAMSGCTFSGNSCTGTAFGTAGGGGALSLGPTVASTVTNCTFSANTQNGVATGQPGGGAIYNYGSTTANPAPITLEHCTFVANVDASGAAGAVRGNYTGSYHTFANVRNSLLVNNQAPASSLRNFAGNPTGSLTATYNSLGGNATDESASSGQFMVSSIDAFGNAALAPTVWNTLALNGGTIATHSISRGSPAQRRGLTSSVVTDQRGAPRHAHADAGSFELIEPELALSVAQIPLPEAGALAFGTTPFDNPVVQTVTVTNTQTSAFSTGPLQLAGLYAPTGYTSASFPGGSLGNGESTTFTVTLSAVNGGLFNAPLTFTGNDAYDPALALAQAGSPNQHTFQLTGLVTDTIDHWRRTYFGPNATNSGNAADDANPSGDGIVNLLKYSLGLNPLLSYAPGTGLTTALDSTGHLRMTVGKNPAATDLAFAIQVGGDLAGWTINGTTVEQNTPTLLQAHDNASAIDVARRFIRLQVTRP